MEENQVIEQTETTTTEQPVEQPKGRWEEQKLSNMALMRKRAESEEAARIEAERKYADLQRELEEERRKNSSAPLSTSHDEDDAIDPEDYLQGKTFKKTTSKLKSRQSEQDKKIQEMQERLSYFEAKSELSTIKDFYEVLTDDNIKTFARLYPDDYSTVVANGNLTAKSKTMYNMIKNYGIADTNMQKTENRIESNKSKPQSASNAGAQSAQTPLTRLGDYERRVLTEQDRDRILAEVNRKRMLG